MFDSILMQVAVDGTGGTIAQLLSAFVNSVAILVGVIALIISGLVYIKAKSQDPKIKQALDLGISLGRLSTLTAAKSSENKENMRALIDYVNSVLGSKDVEKTEAEGKDLFEKLDKEIKITNIQLKRLTAEIPAAANVDFDPLLPRESDVS
jgi:hypothetical protein